jgi:hypothetical protein
MAVVESERHGQVLVLRLNRPERLNALNGEMRTALAELWTEFRHDKDLEVAIFTGAGRGFCAGEDMKESLASGTPGGKRPAIADPFMDGTLEKPVIAAVNGFAMGGGFMLVERTDLRLAVPEAVFEVSEAKRWLLGGYNDRHGDGTRFPLPSRALVPGRLPQPAGAAGPAHTDGAVHGRAPALAAAGLARKYRAHDASDAAGAFPRPQGARRQVA